MRVADSMQAARGRAAEALKVVLHQVSQIKLKGMDVDSPRPDLRVDILAHVDVHGKSHTLVCKVRASGRPEHVRMALEEFQGDAAQFSRDATPVLIVPSCSEESRALCRESKAGFLDLEGNARIDLGEVFIGKRSLPLVREGLNSPIAGRRKKDQPRLDPLVAVPFGPGPIAGAA
ncbi:MAG: hypothetical protein WA802_04240 [Terracidiphilus sp.]